jgi:hypothetical protein
MISGAAYWLPDVHPSDAKEHPSLAAIQHAGPWQYAGHPLGGTFVTMIGMSDQMEDYKQVDPTAGGLQYLPPKAMPTLYDLAKPTPGTGVVVQLACGLVAEIPVAVVRFRQLRLSRSAGERLGDPVTEYGRLSVMLLDRAKVEGGLPHDDEELLRLIILAFSQRYRVTAELFDDLGIFSTEDVEPMLGAIWCGDPKAGAPASDGTPSV